MPELKVNEKRICPSTYALLGVGRVLTKLISEKRLVLNSKRSARCALPRRGGGR